MAEIFISHSRRDPEERDWLRSLFGDTHVRAICKEFGAYMVPPAADIAADIQRSKAVFLLLTPGILSSDFTRNWVSFEAASALYYGRPLWIFEQIETPTEFPIPGIHPNLARYLPYSRTWPDLDDYIRQVICGYEDPDWLGTLQYAAGGAGGGALLGSSRDISSPGRGALIGSLLGGGLKLISSLPQPPKGIILITCPYPLCGVQFELHAPVSPFPCPTCRQRIELNLSGH